MYAKKGKKQRATNSSFLRTDLFKHCDTVSMSRNRIFEKSIIVVSFNVVNKVDGEHFFLNTDDTDLTDLCFARKTFPCQSVLSVFDT